MNDSAKLEKLIQKHIIILEHPYWAIDNDNDLKNRINSNYKLNSFGFKLIWSENLLSSIWVSGGTSIITSLIMMGLNEIGSAIEKKIFKIYTKSIFDNFYVLYG